MSAQLLDSRTTVRVILVRLMQIVSVFFLSYGILHFCSGIAANLVTSSNRPTSQVPEPVEYDTFSIYYEQCHCANLDPTNATASIVPCAAMSRAVDSTGDDYINKLSELLIYAVVAAATDLALFPALNQRLNAVQVARLITRGVAVGLVVYSAWLNVGVVEHLKGIWTDVCPAGHNLIDFGAYPTTRYYTRIMQAVVHLLLAAFATCTLFLGSKRPSGVVFVAAALILVWDNVAAELPDYFEVPGGLVKHLKGKAFAPGFKGEYVGLWHVCDCKPFVCEDERATLYLVKLLLAVGAAAMGATLVAAGYELSISRFGVSSWRTAAAGASAVASSAFGWQCFRDWFMPGDVAHCAAGVTFMNNQQFAWGYYLMGMPGLYWFATGLAFLSLSAFIARRV
jgi:hypothetical protein